MLLLMTVEQSFSCVCIIFHLLIGNDCSVSEPLHLGFLNISRQSNVMCPPTVGDLLPEVFQLSIPGLTLWR